MSDKKKILVIDDDPGMVTFLTTLLEDSGYETVSAGDGAEGIKKTSAEKPDLVLLDITMPETSGVKLYRTICDDPETKEIPVIMVTGVMEQFRKFIHSRRQVPPPAAYFQKPVDKDELLAKIAELLG